MSIWLILSPFGFFFFWLFLTVFLTGRGKVCPDCSTPLSFLQSPFTMTWRQWVEGGYLCPNCGCEMDLAGRKVAAGTPPQRRSILIAIGLLTLTAVPAIILLILLLRPISHR